MGESVSQRFPRLYPIVDAGVLVRCGWDVRGFAAELRAAGVELLQYRNKTGSPQEVLRFMADATAGVVSTDPFDSSVFAGCPLLRVLARVGVGVMVKTVPVLIRETLEAWNRYSSRRASRLALRTQVVVQARPVTERLNGSVREI